MSQNDRFWEKVDKNGPGGCWLWTAYRLPSGYGQINWNGRSQRAHRVAYEIVLGPIPARLPLDHRCFVRHCVNPYHLEPVTATENRRRETARKTTCPSGHPYDATNTYLYRTQRMCRICRRDRQRVTKKGVFV